MPQKSLINLLTTLLLLTNATPAISHPLLLSQVPQTIPSQISDIRKVQSDSQLQQSIENLQRRQAKPAIELLSKILPVYQEMSDSPAEAYTLGNLGVAYELLGDTTQAIQYLKQSLTIANTSEKTTINPLISLKLKAEILSALGRVYLQTNQLSEAEIALKEAIKNWETIRNQAVDIQKRNLFDQQVHTYLTLQKVLIAQNKIETALEVSERGRTRAIVELLAKNLSKQLTNVTFDSPSISEIQKISKNHRSILVEYSFIEDDFRPLIPESTQLNPENPEAPELDFYLYIDPTQQQKKATSLLYIWVIQPTGEIAFRSVNLQSFFRQGDSSISEIVLRTRDAIGARGRGLGVVAKLEEDSGSKIINQLKQLNQILIEPIVDLLPKNPEERVTFIPQGSLFLVPFAGLQDSTGTYLIEKHTILTAPSIQVLDLTQIARQKNHEMNETLVVGNPTMPQFIPLKTAETLALGTLPKPERLPSLPGAEIEANTIANLLNTSALTGQEATETQVIQKIENARIIHLATHGLLDNFITNFVAKPGEIINLEDYHEIGTPGAIALAPAASNVIALSPPNGEDGFLTTGEILNLKLNAELVVLSACDTGRGEISGDGVVGLSRSFIAVGVPSLVVSLWTVPDIPTTSLMIEFYRNLQQKMDKATALRQAMLTTKQQYPNPIEWAAFTLIGEAD